MKHIVSRMSSYFPNRWPLSYLDLTKNMKTYIRRQQHKIFLIVFNLSLVVLSLVFYLAVTDFLLLLVCYTVYFSTIVTMTNSPDRVNPTLITKTCPCKVYPLKPHFYIEILGYAGVYLFFLFLLQNIDCGYSLEPPQRGGSNVYPQSMF